MSSFFAAGDSPAVGGKRTPLAVRVGGLLVAAACAGAALRRADLAAVGASLAAARPALLTAAVAANVASLAAHAARWHAVVRAPGVRVPYRAALAALVAGFAAGIALPARGADLVRAHLLARRAGLSTAAVLSASALEYVIGSLALVALVAWILVLVPLPPWVGRGLGVFAALAAAAAMAAWLLRPPAARGRGAPGVAGRLRVGLAAVRDPRALLAAVGWAILGWIAEGAIALATLGAVGLPATPATACVAVFAASAVSAIPLVPGNAGSFELATMLAVTGTGAPPDEALAFAMAFHLVHIIPVAILGGAALVWDAVARDP